MIVAKFAANPAESLTTHVLNITVERANNKTMTVRKANNAQPNKAVVSPIKKQEKPDGISGLKIKVRQKKMNSPCSCSSCPLQGRDNNASH
ncbi:hypothetical protein [Candidatus Electrothrix sp.]|uniref:hypothetical protein n=2 Tax=Candidatus Electrothrix sp. TaxID=2170559 RepID=UPI004055BB75